MKKKILFSSLVACAIIVAGAKNYAASTNVIKDADKNTIQVNGSDYKEIDVYNKITVNGEYSAALAVIDYKVFKNLYKDDKRFSDLKADRKTTFESQYTTPELQKEQFNIVQAKDFDEYFTKAALDLEVYRELAKIDATYEYIYGEKERKAVYDKQISGTIKIKRILISPEISIIDSADAKKLEAAEAKALQKAQKAIDEIKNGKSYDEVYKKYSSDQSSSLGNLGEYTIDTAVADTNLDKNVLSAAFALKKDEVSKPIKTNSGYEVVMADIVKAKPSYKDSSAAIKEKMYQIVSKENTNLANYALVVFREKNNIKFDSNNYSKIYANEYIKYRKAFMDNQSQYNYGN